MKNTALSELHAAIGGKMVEFAGYNMPVQYEGITVEHFAVRNSVGMFDVSHMGEFILKGPNALTSYKLLLRTMHRNLPMVKCSIHACQMIPVALWTICLCTASMSNRICL